MTRSPTALRALAARRSLTTPWIIALVVALVAAGCRSATIETNPADDAEPVSSTLLTNDSFFISEGILETFTMATGIEVELLAGGDAGAMVSQAILTKDNPLADVIFGVDNTFLGRATAAGIFDPYTSQAADLPVDLLADGVTPIDFGDVCLNYRVEAIGDLSTPSSLDDLLLP